MDRHERAHYRRVEVHVEAVRRILDAAAGQAARAAELYGGLDAEGHFSFSARPALARARQGAKSRQEGAKLAKEQRMCEVFAAAGYRVEMLEEVPGVPSPDVRINGRLADLKSVSSAKQIARRAKRAVRGQGAELVLFEFAEESEAVYKELLALKREGIPALFYFKGSEIVYKN